ncbi:TPA: hypothetical protein N0F65_005678 [Lagenidium giganteum]|uniref:RRM domain-containing protein n=1 Tax=Lagenidium giganteum TaxID=4803 RepID=A0AAV2ZA23_9STRA|nr:TPA: hypothetical protein N0F65_005678 [Lagenidium giganteum]
MPSLDDELAQFEAELKSLEAATEQSKKRGRDEETAPKDNGNSSSADAEPRAKKQDTGDKKAKAAASKAKAEKVVIFAAPKVYIAPPRPAPARPAAPTTSTDRQPASSVHNDTTANGALSGFPVGTSGEYAAQSSLMSTARQPVQRIDMTTGELMSAEEQHLMNQQQSVYEYNPNKPVSAAAGANGGAPMSKKAKRNIRMAGGEVWEDPSLADWPDNDFRLFCGDLGNEVTDELLVHSFSRYPSFQRARVIRDKYTHKSRGYGFVSFLDPFDCAKALREMNGKYIGNRPVKLSKSKWQDRNIDVAKKKMKKRKDRHHLFT